MRVTILRTKCSGIGSWQEKVQCKHYMEGLLEGVWEIQRWAACGLGEGGPAGRQVLHDHCCGGPVVAVPL